MKQTDDATSASDFAWEKATAAFAQEHGLDPELVSADFFPINQAEGPAFPPPVWMLKSLMTKRVSTWNEETGETELRRSEEWTQDLFDSLKPGGAGA
jgi:hypothetical protein